MLAALEHPPHDLAELRTVRLADHQWRRGEQLVRSGRWLILEAGFAWPAAENGRGAGLELDGGA